MIKAAVIAILLSICAFTVGAVMAVALQILSDKYKCWGAPKVVAFYQGMTICPGQTAILTPWGNLQYDLPKDHK
jgi:hypothetical protein